MFSKLAIDFAGSVAVCLCRTFCTIEKAKVKAFSSNRYVNLPFAGGTVPRDTLVPRLIINCLRAIKAVLLVRDFSKICQSIVGSIAVYVIYLAKRPLPIMHSPRNSMRRNYRLIDANFDIPVANSSSFLSRPCPSCCMFPQKFAALLVVREPLVKKIDRNFAHIDRIPSFLNGVKYGLSW